MPEGTASETVRLAILVATKALPHGAIT